MINRLITFGDSYTYGDELQNRLESAWPILVANKFNLELKNLGWPGYSNDIILEKVVDEKITKNDIAIVCFSSFQRMYFEDKKGWFTTIPNIKQISETRNDITKNLFATLSIDWLYQRWLKQVIYLQTYFKYHKINYLFFVANHAHNNYGLYYSKYQNLTDLIDLTYFPGWPEVTFETLTWHLPRGEFKHPLEDSHKVFAGVISENIVQIFNLTKN